MSFNCINQVKGASGRKVIEGFYNGITTSEIDTLAAETCAYMSQKHHDFSTLAARIAVSNLHKIRVIRP